MQKGDHAVKGEKVERSWSLDSASVEREGAAFCRRHIKPETAQ